MTHYRSIFISDLHLGTKACKAEFLLDFLKHTESDHLYLVGDIIDGWQLKKNWFWNQHHNDIIQKILRKARKGTKVTYVTGNHDEFLRGFSGIHLGGVELVNECIHTSATGKKFLVIHGDQFDNIMKYGRWLAKLGDWAYDTLIEINHHYNLVRRHFGQPYWSLSSYLKTKVKNAMQFISDYSNTVVAEAKLRNVSGVICGHIHFAEITDIHGITYMNDGDFQESCTALVEHYDGTFEILKWVEIRQLDIMNSEAA